EFSAGPAASAVTSAGGAYSMTLSPGSYVVVEVARTSCTEGLPSGTDIVAATGTGLGDFGYAISLTSGQNDTGNSFGNFQQATKSGIKFNDLNANGVLDSGEPGVPGFTIEAFKDSDGDGTLSQAEFSAGPAASAVTSAGGAYSMTLNPGSYVVVEVAQSGWTESRPSGTDIVAATDRGRGV